MYHFAVQVPSFVIVPHPVECISIPFWFDSTFDGVCSGYLQIIVILYHPQQQWRVAPHMCWLSPARSCHTVVSVYYQPPQSQVLTASKFLSRSLMTCHDTYTLCSSGQSQPISENKTEADNSQSKMRGDRMSARLQSGACYTVLSAVDWFDYTCVC